MKNTSIKLLREIGACDSACAWVENGKFESLEDAWKKCERGDWMLWFAAKRKIERKKLVLIACECARLALPYAKSPDVLACIETAEAWTRGEVTIDDVRAASRKVVYADAAAYAADAAAYAADAAYYAADAAYAAAYAADAAAYARKSVLLKCAEIVRKHLPELP